MAVTVAHMRGSNIHVQNTPEIMLKDDAQVVSDLNLKVHGVAQGALYGAFPASTIPGLVKNPILYSAGAGSGLVLGAICRLLKETSCPQQASYIKDWKDWFGYYAALNNVSKAILGSVQGLGVIGSTLINVFNNNNYGIISEGVVAGSFAGYEAAGYAVHLWRPRQDAQPLNVQEVPDEESRLVVQTA